MFVFSDTSIEVFLNKKHMKLRVMFRYYKCLDIFFSSSVKAVNCVPHMD